MEIYEAVVIGVVFLLVFSFTMGAIDAYRMSKGKRSLLDT